MQRANLEAKLPGLGLHEEHQALFGRLEHVGDQLLALVQSVTFVWRSVNCLLAEDLVYDGPQLC
ncbi:MAG: hypothetical protein J0L92_06750 [Deltaproteobacteria bacterium]|nr:hypothetical protein [Deltaproteobacteria bacterium]